MNNYRRRVIGMAEYIRYKRLRKFCLFLPLTTLEIVTITYSFGAAIVSKVIVRAMLTARLKPKVYTPEERVRLFKNVLRKLKAKKKR